MPQTKPDLVLDAIPEPRRITFDIAAVDPSKLTLLDALDIAKASGIPSRDFSLALKGTDERKRAMLLYAFAWVLGRRVEPGLSFEEVMTCHLTVIGTPISAAKAEEEMDRARTVVSVAKLAGVTPAEAEQMTVTQAAAVVELGKRRARRR